jgi:hypothetical protein
LEVKPGERFQICRREVNNQVEECFEWMSRSQASQAPGAAQPSELQSMDVPSQQGQNLQTTMARQAKPAIEPRQRRMVGRALAKSGLLFERQPWFQKVERALPTRVFR